MVESNQQDAEIPVIYLLHDGTLDPGAFSEYCPERRLIGLTWDQRGTPPAGARLLMHLSDDQLRELAPLALEKHWEIGVLPHPQAGQAIRALGVRGGVEQMFRHYLSADAIEADVLICNGQLVFSSVVIGDVLTLSGAHGVECVAGTFRAVC